MPLPRTCIRHEPSEVVTRSEKAQLGPHHHEPLRLISSRPKQQQTISRTRLCSISRRSLHTYLPRSSERFLHETLLDLQSFSAHTHHFPIHQNVSQTSFASIWHT